MSDYELVNPEQFPALPTKPLSAKTPSDVRKLSPIVASLWTNMGRYLSRRHNMDEAGKFVYFNYGFRETHRQGFWHDKPGEEHADIDLADCSTNQYTKYGTLLPMPFYHSRPTAKQANTLPFRRVTPYTSSELRFAAEFAKLKEEQLEKKPPGWERKCPYHAPAMLKTFCGTRAQPEGQRQWDSFAQGEFPKVFDPQKIRERHLLVGGDRHTSVHQERDYWKFNYDNQVQMQQQANNRFHAIQQENVKLREILRMNGLVVPVVPVVPLSDWE